MNEACQTRGLQSLRIWPDQVLLLVSVHNPSVGTEQQTSLPVKGLSVCGCPSHVHCYQPYGFHVLGRSCLPAKQQGAEIRVDYIITIQVNVLVSHLMYKCRS
jgi:hypothetical protein